MAWRACAGRGSQDRRLFSPQLLGGARARRERHPAVLLGGPEPAPDLPAAEPEPGGLDRQPAPLPWAGTGLPEGAALGHRARGALHALCSSPPRPGAGPQELEPRELLASMVPGAQGTAAWGGGRPAPKIQAPRAAVPGPVPGGRSQALCPAGQENLGVPSAQPGTPAAPRPAGGGGPPGARGVSSAHPVLTAANAPSVQQDAVLPVWDRGGPQLPGRPRLLQPAVQPRDLLAQRERLLRPGQQDSGVR